MRALRVLPVALLLGCLMNVGIAWWCATSVDPMRTPPQTMYHIEEGRWLLVRRWETVGGTYVVSRRLHDATLAAVMPSSLDSHPAWQLPRMATAATVGDRQVQGRGWPWLSMWSEWAEPVGPGGSRVVRGGFAVPAGGTGPLGRPSVIPLYVIWPGFTANTLLYALLFWSALTAPWAIRSHVRRYRGRCVNCGYMVAELPQCPECGAITRSPA